MLQELYIVNVCESKGLRLGRVRGHSGKTKTHTHTHKLERETRAISWKDGHTILSNLDFAKSHLDFAKSKEDSL